MENSKNILKYYDDFYRTHKNFKFEKSLLDFINLKGRDYLQKDSLKILDLGPGTYSLFEELSLIKAEIVAVDFSSEAIRNTPAQSQIKYFQDDLSNKDFLQKYSKNYFNLIFDSHCFHCIVTPQKRRVAFKNVYDLLAEDGVFMGEMMIQSQPDSRVHPLKYIPTAQVIEEELIKAGFKINYFLVVRDLIFDLSDGSEKGISEEVELLRIVATK